MPDSHAKEESSVFLSKLANCQLDNYELWQAGLPAMPDSHAKEDSTVFLGKLADC